MQFRLKIPRLGGRPGWRGPAKGPRPLQISEVVQAVDEHLRAAALPSLRLRYLPTVLEIWMSDGDWAGLRPFEEHLREAILEVYAELAGKSGFAARAPAPEIKFLADDEISLGNPPVIESGFSERDDEATWKPGKRIPSFAAGAAPVRPSRVEEGVFEFLITSDFQGGTARQSMLLVCLTAELPLGLVARAAAVSPPGPPGGTPAETLRLDGERRIVTAGGEEWEGPAPERKTLPEAPPPIEGLAHEETGVLPTFALPVFRFQPSQRPAVVWAPGGALVIGRGAGESHWVPASAPSNLSGRHLALVLMPGTGFFVCDLESTNGVYLGGARLPALRLAELELPAALDIGKEGSMRIEVRPAPAVAEASRESAGLGLRRAGGTVQEEGR